MTSLLLLKIIFSHFVELIFRMYTAEKLCLQWNNFKESLHKTIGNLRVTNKFNDVTLAAEGSEQIEAHKVILASSSPFFEYENETGNSDPKPPLFETSFSDQQEGVNYFELDKQIESMTRKTGKIFACKVCGKEGSRKAHRIDAHQWSLSQL